MNKIIFLDIDGTINPEVCHDSEGYFSKICCQNLNYILIKCPDARIVISSSWRSRGLENMQRILGINGIDSTKVVDLTPGNPHERGLSRQHHIEEWLLEHLEVENFVILDDMAEIADLKDKYVVTNSYIGLTLADAEKAIKILKS